MSASAADVTKIRTLVSRLQKLTLRDSNQIALVGLMTGVLYALQRTVELCFDDARMNLDPDIERAEIGRTLEAPGVAMLLRLKLPSNVSENSL